MYKKFTYFEIFVQFDLFYRCFLHSLKLHIVIINLLFDGIVNFMRNIKKISQRKKNKMRLDLILK